MVATATAPQSTDARPSRSSPVPVPRLVPASIKFVLPLASSEGFRSTYQNMQALVDEFAILRKNRFLEYGPDTREGISYAKATASLIGCPFKIESKEDALALPFISVKTGARVEEFLEKGYIEEARELVQSQRFNALSDFSTVQGVGYAKAREIYNSGIHTMEQLRATGRFSFKYHEDLQLKMSRADVESIEQFVKIQLDKTEPGAHTIICGGYRRGKTESNDVDIIITYPHQDGKERGVLKRLVARLQAKGLVPPDGVLTEVTTGSDRITIDNKPASHMDSLDHAFVIFIHPPNDSTRPRAIARRLDLIVTPWRSYGSAVVGWSGSTQFERDLRIHARNIGLKFDSGGIHNAVTNDTVPAVTEEDVFRVMGLAFLPPELRNADP